MEKKTIGRDSTDKATNLENQSPAKGNSIEQAGSQRAQKTEYKVTGRVPLTEQTAKDSALGGSA